MGRSIDEKISCVFFAAFARFVLHGYGRVFACEEMRGAIGATYLDRDAFGRDRNFRLLFANALRVALTRLALSNGFTRNVNIPGQLNRPVPLIRITGMCAVILFAFNVWRISSPLSSGMATSQITTSGEVV